MQRSRGVSAPASREDCTCKYTVVITNASLECHSHENHDSSPEWQQQEWDSNYKFICFCISFVFFCWKPCLLQLPRRVYHTEYTEIILHGTNMTSSPPLSRILPWMATWGSNWIMDYWCVSNSGLNYLGLCSIWFIPLWMCGCILLKQYCWIQYIIFV